MTFDKKPVQSLLPLREPTFYILISVAQGEKHGYAILKDVEMLSGGKLKLSTGTLYEALARLLEQGLVERKDAPLRDKTGGNDRHPGKPRIVYNLSPFGLKVLQEETARLHHLAAIARRRLGQESS